MSNRVSGVAVSKPGRESWLMDEVLDTIIPHDPGASMVETRFKSVFLVYSSLDPVNLARIVSAGYHSFMKRFVPALSVFRVGVFRELEDRLSSILANTNLGHVRLITALRGKGKSIASRSLIEGIVRGLGLKPSRRSSKVIDIESIDDLFIIAYGITRYCGPDCILVYPI